MNFHETKAAHRQNCKPIRTHSESLAGWLVAVLIAFGLALAIVEWWTM